MTTLDSKALLRGEAPVALLLEGATRAPVVVFWAFSKGQLIGKG
jgi:hypothetical protein